MNMYKDVVYHRMKKFYKSDVKKHPIPKAIGLDDVVFGTLNEVFEGAANQPIIYSGNLKHVLDLAAKEERGIDVMGGICIFGYGRIAVKHNSSNRFDLWMLPKEIDSESHWSVNDFFNFEERQRWKGANYKLDLSAANLEPTLGRVAKIFNILEVMKCIGEEYGVCSAHVTLPTEEYMKVRSAIARKIGIPEEDVSRMESIHADIADKYARTIESIRSGFFQNVDVSTRPTHDERIKKQTRIITKNERFRKGVEDLGKFSYHRKANPSEECMEEERGYISLFLGDEGKMITHKNSHSRVIVLNARDIDSFLLQSMYVFQQLSDYEVNDRLAFVGVGGGPAITRAGSKELLFPVDFQDAGYDDYFAKAPLQVLSPSEDIKVSGAKMLLPHAKRATTSPIFSYLNNLGRFFGTDQTSLLLDRWKSGQFDGTDGIQDLLTVINIQEFLLD